VANETCSESLERGKGEKKEGEINAIEESVAGRMLLKVAL